MRHARRIATAALSLLLALGIAALASAQTFTSGSTGADGVFNPPTTVPPGTTVNGSTYTVPLPASGTFNFTTITIPTGTTVKFARNATNTPVTLLASGDITVAGIIDLNGTAGTAYQTTTATYPTGGKGGPGGYDGGSGETKIGNSLAGNGLGPGGGKGPTGSSNPSSVGCEAGGAGYLNAGEASYSNSNCGTYDGVGGPAYGNTALLPLLGGSGGGGGGAISGMTGGGGGGGGGAILIATSGTFTLTGTIRANGGAGGNGNTAGWNGGAGGGGAGGAIRLMATTLAGTGGTVTASGGTRGLGYSSYSLYGGAGSVGRLRLESFSSTASWTISPSPSQTVPGSVQLANMPALTITSVAGVAAPSAPTGSYSVPDVTLPPTATSPVAVALAASNIPLGTTVTVTATPLVGAATTATSTGLSGSIAASTATASLSVSFNTATVLTATATFTLLADAGGGPLYAEGEEVTHVRVAAALGGSSAVMYLTRTGREIVVR